jgi:hypothetical protein
MFHVQNECRRENITKQGIFKDNRKGKVKLSLYRPWRTLGLREVEAPTFSDIRLTDGGKFANLMRRPLFTPRSFLVLISVRCLIESSDVCAWKRNCHRVETHLQIKPTIIIIIIINRGYHN